MSGKIQQALDTIQIMNKSTELREEQSLAKKRHSLQSAEFEQLLRKETVTSTEIDEGKRRLIELYELYIDASLTLRAFTIDAEKRLEAIIKDQSSGTTA